MLSNQLIEKFNEAFAQHSLSTMKQIFLSSNLLQEEKAKLLKDCASDNNAIQTTGSSSSNFCQYRLACQQGDVEMVGFYLNMAAATSSNALLTEMIELAECDGPYWPFRICCTNGHTDVIKLIWSVATPIQQLAMLECKTQTGDFWGFRYVCEKGYFDTASLLLSLAQSPHQHMAMLSAVSYSSFRLAAQNGHSRILKLIYNVAPDQTARVEMLQARNCAAFRLCAQNGHVQISRMLYEWAGCAEGTDTNGECGGRHLQREMLESMGFCAFRLACQNGYVDLVELLYSFACQHEGFNRAILSVANDIGYYSPFQVAAQNGNVEIVDMLYTYADIEMRQEMLEFKSPASASLSQFTTSTPSSPYWPFRAAVERGHIEVVKLLLSFASNQQKKQMIEFATSSGPYWAFRTACAKGYLKLARLLYSCGTAVHKREMVEVKEYVSFISAAKAGFPAILQMLYEVAAPYQRQSMITAWKFSPSNAEFANPETAECLQELIEMNEIMSKKTNTNASDTSVAGLHGDACHVEEVDVYEYSEVEEEEDGDDDCEMNDDDVYDSNNLTIKVY